ncbi:hypothetical protein FA15DRAFT_672523 [Coprinopsis marcescibilis]|uniref:BRCT domain-containing protein n=1 Tax=Coprinopsis marcescibilis TaxID=230819 RepID=A0A5C3KM92_COPMA|nr:hypothetical protein FA15DRAFT_672523 [Coprinopsis marcescibilis]
MKRRSNKSHKVPNVKLRPAQASYGDLSGSSQCLVQESQFDSDDTRMLDPTPRPFKGVVVCATGVKDKTTLFKQALELGAISVPALTDRVTHLIATEPGSAKYYCAIKRKIPILQPSWISESYNIWQRGDDVELETTVAKYSLPIFSGVVLCASGIEAGRRRQISKLVEEHEGSYAEALERPVRVTHLLCSGDEETEKMKYARKFNKNGEADIQLLWEEWFWDSLEFGGRWPEETYQVNNPKPERMVIDMAPSQAFDSDPSRAGSLQPKSQKPRPPVDINELEDETASVDIVPAVRAQVWGGLLERRGYEISEGKVIRSPTKAQSLQTDRLSTSFPQGVMTIRQRNARSVISAVRSTNSFAPVETEAGPSVGKRAIPFRRSSTTTSGLNRADTPLDQGEGPRYPNNPDDQPLDNIAGPSSVRQDAEPTPIPQMFSGMKICALGEARSLAVKTAVEGSGGIYALEEDSDIDFFVVRLLSGSKIYRSEPDTLLRKRYRTECWLERCVHEERICQPEEHISFVPLGINIPVLGAEKIHIGLSGLDQSESCHTRRLLRALGITLVPQFSRKTTHLLCPSGTGLKFDKAGEWGIPVVSNGWLEAIVRQGRICSLDEHIVKGPPSTENDVTSRPADPKGKGKASDIHNDMAGDMADMDIDEDVRMQDITNNIQPGASPRDPASQLPVDKQQVPSLAKHNTLERHATVLCEGGPPERPLGMGQPTELLGGAETSSLYVDPSSVQTLAHDPPLVRYGTRASSSVAHTVDGSFFGNGKRTQSDESVPQEQQEERAKDTPSRKQSLRSHSSKDAADKFERIPSSKSPSPMKMPISRRVSSMSPAKFDPGHLKDSIESLLGKRSSPDEEPVEAGNENAESAQVEDPTNGARNTKRKRPQRGKATARIRAQRTRSTTTTMTRSGKSSSPAPALAPVLEGVSLSAFNAYGAMDDESQALDELQQSARVVYEDPAQVQERDRLMNMLKTTVEAVVDVSQSSTISSLLRPRRATRLSVRS